MQLTNDVKATENKRIMADTTDSTSCVQKLSQPKRLQAAAAFARFLRAGSLMLAEVTWTGMSLLELPAEQETCNGTYVLQNAAAGHTRQSTSADHTTCRL